MQREFYTGWKKKHGVKFQALHFPDGLTGHLHGAVPTRRTDAWVLRDSGLQQQWAQVAWPFSIVWCYLVCATTLTTHTYSLLHPTIDTCI